MNTPGPGTLAWSRSPPVIPTAPRSSTAASSTGSSKPTVLRRPEAWTTATSPPQAPKAPWAASSEQVGRCPTTPSSTSRRRRRGDLHRRRTARRFGGRASISTPARVPRPSPTWLTRPATGSACSPRRRPDGPRDRESPRELYDELTDDLLYDPAVGRATMMGYPCVRLAGRFLASYDDKAGHLVVKLPRERVSSSWAKAEASPSPRPARCSANGCRSPLATGSCGGHCSPKPWPSRARI